MRLIRARHVFNFLVFNLNLIPFKTMPIRYNDISFGFFSFSKLIRRWVLLNFREFETIRVLKSREIYILR